MAGPAGHNMAAKFLVAATKQPLLSAGCFIAKGFLVVFAGPGANRARAPGGQKMCLDARRGAFELWA